MSYPRWGSLFVATALLAGIRPGQAADTPKPTPPAFGSAITVVTVPVFVTDDVGRSVAGLGEDAFEVTDDGKPMRIVGFREIDVADPTTQPQLREAPAARRQFLLLFDLSFTNIAGLSRARQAAREFVEHGMQPLDLAGVATFSANYGIKILLAFTSDRAQLRKAVDTLGVLQLDRRTDPLGLVYDLSEVSQALVDVNRRDNDTGNSSNLDSAFRALQLRFEHAERENYKQRVRALVDGMGQLAKALDSVQGRKQVILLSAGFDQTSLTGVQGVSEQRDSEAVVRGRLWEVESDNRFGDSGLRSEMEDVFKNFSSSDAVVHTVDLAGLGTGQDLRQQTSAANLGLQSGAVRVDPRAGQASLAHIAGLSGGRFFKDTNDVGVALNELLEMSRRYYVLAFEPQDLHGPGKFHKLKIKLHGKGFKVSHRSGYFERKPFEDQTPLAKRFEAAEIIAKGVTGGEIEVRALAVPYRNAAGRATLPVVLEMDGPSLLGKGKGSNLGLEVYGYALDEAGTIEDVIGLVSNLNLPKVGERLRGRGLQCHGAFTLAPGKHSLRFLVRDAETGRSGSTWLDVTIPPLEAGGEVVLYPPLFMDDPQRWLVVEAPSRGTQGLDLPFHVASDNFVPRTRPHLRNGRTESICLLAFDGGVRYDPGASFEIKAQLIGANGAPVPLGRFVLERATAETDGFRRFVMRLTPADVVPGDYTLRVRLRDPASGRVSEAFQRVSVDDSPRAEAVSH
jgi:VWFA-related protein